MTRPEYVLRFRALKTTVFEHLKTDGGRYEFATPRKKKDLHISVISVNPRGELVDGKPQYYVKNGRGEVLTGLYFDPATGTGYGNFEKRDTLIFLWDREACLITVLVLKDRSKGAAEDKLWHDRFLKGGVARETPSGKVSMNTVVLETESATGSPQGEIND
ncbi:MAG: hypothetical protein WCG80_02540 [Spirochaetales bacterium]